ncbi:hypothetical protein [Halorussus litoreus]|uniref:hypothetical protein n=1 Tax=Halorussus litoreus TaxID=1710536 RepID=UPI0013002530|nr:hypothetical protein [Halorussus litoreus]
MSDRDLAERFGDLDVNDRVRVTTDGTEFEGPASPIDYVPEESLRVEVRPENSDERYELRAEYEDGWSDVAVRLADMDGEDTAWQDLGTVERVEAESESGESKGGEGENEGSENSEGTESSGENSWEWGVS